jgi:hypothetical protein
VEGWPLRPGPARAAAQFTELARLPGIEGKTWNHPVVVRDTLLVRNDQEMAAFKTRGSIRTVSRLA